MTDSTEQMSHSQNVSVRSSSRRIGNFNPPDSIGTCGTHTKSIPRIEISDQRRDRPKWDVLESAHKTYFQVLSRSNWTTWLWSAGVAVCLNLGLFLLMPYLINSAPSKPTMETLLPQIRMIRYREPETERETEKPPEPPKEEKVEQPKNEIQRMTPRELTLPFEMNPRLPAGPGDLVLPDLKSVPLSYANLPNAFGESQLDAPLTALVRVPPVYPLQARRRGVEGWVKVILTVNENGFVEDVTVLDADPAGVFERSVEACVMNWRFEPGTVDGAPVRARVETTIEFHLASGEE